MRIRTHRKYKIAARRSWRPEVTNFWLTFFNYFHLAGGNLPFSSVALIKFKWDFSPPFFFLRVHDSTISFFEAQLEFYGSWSFREEFLFFLRLTSCMMSNELKVIVLIPMLQWKFLEWGCVGELEVSKVPIEDLTILTAQVNVTDEEFLKF